MLYQTLKIISLAGLAFFLGAFISYNRTEQNPTENIVEPQSQTAGTANFKNNETPPELEAKAACVFDFSEKKFLFSLNADQQMPLASLTKMMTALTAKERLPQTEEVEITKNAILQEGDTGLVLGESWPMPDLINIMLISSSNDAAFAIASSFSSTQGGEAVANEIDFVNLMNQKAKILGMANTYFLNSTGLDISKSTAGGYGSCEDLVNFLSFVLKEHQDILEITGQESIELRGKIFKNTNELLPKLPFLIGGKTGYSDLAGGNLAVVVDKGPHHPVAIIALGSSWQGRFNDVEILYNKYIK